MSRGFRLVSRGVGDLKTRYRPQCLSEAVPTFPINRVKKILDDPNASQVYLFEGPSGSGKTSVARIIARASVCDSAGEEKPCLECGPCRDLEKSTDYMEINVANFRKIDDIRAVIEGMCYLPSNLRRKIYIFDEVHQASNDYQQVLLKTLEEPPPEMLIFLCTTERQGLKRALIDRATSVAFKRLSRDQALKIAEQVGEDQKVVVPDNIRDDMYRRADGSVRALMNLLQAFFEDDYTVGEVDEGEAPPAVTELAKALMNRDWPTVSAVLQDNGVRKSPESIRIGVCSYLRAVALHHKTITSTMNAAVPLGQLAGTLSNEPQIDQYNQLVLRCMRACAKK